MSLVLLKQQAVLNKTVEHAEDEEIRQHLAGSISGPAHARDVGDMLVQPLPAPLRGSHWVTPEQDEEEPSALPWLASRHCAAAQAEMSCDRSKQEGSRVPQQTGCSEQPLCPGSVRCRKLGLPSSRGAFEGRTLTPSALMPQTPQATAGERQEQLWKLPP